MVSPKGEWEKFSDEQDRLQYFKNWGLLPKRATKVLPVVYAGSFTDVPIPCEVVGHQEDSWAVISVHGELHCVYGEYFAELQPKSLQKLPFGTSFASILSDYIVLDIETTGFDRSNDRIIEIAANRYSYGKLIEAYEQLINPGIPLPLEITGLTGISQADIQDAPLIREAAPSFISFIGNLPIIGHNIVSFDIPFLSHQLGVEFENTMIDTLTLSRAVFPQLQSHKLECLISSLGLKADGSHRAFHDVESTNNLLWACLSPDKFSPHSSIPTPVPHQSQPKRRPDSSMEDPVPKKTSAYSYEKFRKIYIKCIIPTVDSIDETGPLFKKDVVFTGELSIPREEAMQLAVNAGATIKTAVSKKTGYLVVGKQDKALVGNDGLSSKEEKAIELNQSGKANIHIIQEKEFVHMATPANISI